MSMRKLAFLAAGFMAVAVLAVTFSVLGADPALASVADPHTFVAGHHSVMHVASAALMALRVEHTDLVGKAKAKLAEMVAGLAPEMAAKIETDHADLLRQVAAKAQAIADEEARIAAEKPVAKAWAASFYMSAGAANVPVVDLNEIVASSETLDVAKDKLIAKMAATGNANKPAANGGIIMGTDAREKFVEGVSKSILFKLDGLRDQGERNEFSGRRLFEIARMSLEMNGRREFYGDDLEMIGRAMAPVVMAGGLGSSDFVNVLSNVANKSMLKGYNESPETFREWTAKGSLTDFKAVSRVDLGLFPNLDRVEEGAEYRRAKLTDRGITIALATYGKLFPITRQAIINDDLNAFTKIPMKMGRAAHRTVGNLVYAILISNANAPDGKALFHTDHKNNATGAGSALSASALDAGRAAMGKQTDKDAIAAGLNIDPAFLIVPKSLQGTAHQLMASQAEPGQDNAAVANRVANMAKVVADARLDVDSTAKWYLAASPSQTDTIEVSYLNGNETPTLEQKEGWNTDGVEFKVRHDAAVNLLDSIGFYRGVGA